MSVGVFSGGNFINSLQAAGKNKIINGDFGVWQRGTSFSNPGGGGTYTADRWNTVWDGSGATRTVSQQSFTPGTAPVAGYEGVYYCRYNQSVAGSGATINAFSQKIENVQSYAGQTVTVSFWAKAATTTTMPSIHSYQSFGTGGSAGVDTVVTSNISLTTSWQRFTYSWTVPSISGKTIGTSSFLTVDFYLPINATFTIDLWGVQLESGSVATAFQTATGTLQGELAACQRYFYMLAPTTTNATLMATGQAITTTRAITVIKLPITMRTAPSISVATTGSWFNMTAAFSAAFASSLSLYNNSNQPDSFGLDLTSSGGGLVAGNASVFGASGSLAAQISVSAEL